MTEVVLVWSTARNAHFQISDLQQQEPESSTGPSSVVAVEPRVWPAGTFGTDALEGEVLRGLELKAYPTTIAAIRRSVESCMTALVLLTRTRPRVSASRPPKTAGDPTTGLTLNSSLGQHPSDGGHVTRLAAGAASAPWRTGRESTPSP
jgi:hypothetical protein